MWPDRRVLRHTERRHRPNHRYQLASIGNGESCLQRHGECDGGRGPLRVVNCVRVAPGGVVPWRQHHQFRHDLGYTYRAGRRYFHGKSYRRRGGHPSATSGTLTDSESRIFRSVRPRPCRTGPVGAAYTVQLLQRPEVRDLMPWTLTSGSDSASGADAECRGDSFRHADARGYGDVWHHRDRQRNAAGIHRTNFQHYGGGGGSHWFGAPAGKLCVRVQRIQLRGRRRGGGELRRRRGGSYHQRRGRLQFDPGASQEPNIYGDLHAWRG